jgi:predicted phage terminase large subunit-like protein
MDSALERLLKDSLWDSERFAAHNEDFTELLWPEKLPKEKLLEIRQSYINQGNPDGYSQEYLNKPIDAENAYFHKDDFIHADTPDTLEYYAAIDFAITKKTKSDYTVIAIAGMDDEGVLHIVDIRRGRWDGFEIIENMFWVQEKYSPNLFIAEKGQIKHTLDAFLNAEMVKRGQYINLHAVTPKVDKEQRAKPLQARMRAGGVRFDKEMNWYPSLVDEMLVFPRGQHDDQVDALAYVGLALDKVVSAPTLEELDDELYEQEFAGQLFEGQSIYTGY